MLRSFLTSYFRFLMFANVFGFTRSIFSYVAAFVCEPLQRKLRTLSYFQVIVTHNNRNKENVTNISLTILRKLFHSRFHYYHVHLISISRHSIGRQKPQNNSRLYRLDHLHKYSVATCKGRAQVANQAG